MRTTYALLFFSFLSFSTFVSAQNAVPLANKDITIKSLVDSRIDFNKALIRTRTIQNTSLPQSRYIFNRQGFHKVSIEGLNFNIENKRIIGVDGMSLSNATLNVINERLMVLDKLQYAYSESSNQEYLSGEKNSHIAFNNDRQFFSILKSMIASVNEITKMGKGLDNEDLAHWKQPKIDWEFFSQVMVKESQSQLGK